MSDAYTRVNKPIGTGYTPVNGPGKIAFDDILLSYDEPTVSFDGGDGNSYNAIGKPTGTPYTIIPKPIT